jgi:short-subunit dehydrogenase
MKRVIITGASEGLGLEISKKFKDEGWGVVGISRHKPQGLNIEYIETDLTQEEEINNLIKNIEDKYSEFDALINCAGMISIEELEDIEYEKTEQLIKLNLIAPMMLVSRLKELILENEADILNVGSSISYKAYEQQSAYGASKWGLKGLTENLRLEFKGSKVRVTSFNPGGFQSKLFEKATGESPDLSKFMDPKDLANIIYFIINTPKSLEVSEILINRK